MAAAATNRADKGERSRTDQSCVIPPKRQQTRSSYFQDVSTPFAPSTPLGWTMTRTVSGLATAIALALSLSACGGGSAPSPAAPVAGSPVSKAAAPAASAAPSNADAANASGAACALVTADEVTTAVGKPMKLTGGAGSICTFGEVADPSLFIYVQIYADQASMATPKQLETTGGEHIDGLGDDAFWQGTAGMVFVQKGSRGFSFTLPSLANLTSSPDAVKANMVTLATAALARF